MGALGIQYVRLVSVLVVIVTIIMILSPPPSPTLNVAAAVRRIEDSRTAPFSDYSITP